MAAVEGKMQGTNMKWVKANPNSGAGLYLRSLNKSWYPSPLGKWQNSLCRPPRDHFKVWWGRWWDYRRHTPGKGFSRWTNLFQINCVLFCLSHLVYPFILESRIKPMNKQKTTWHLFERPEWKRWLLLPRFCTLSAISQNKKKGKKDLQFGRSQALWNVKYNLGHKTIQVFSNPQSNKMVIRPKIAHEEYRK